ncbi:MAG: hypothetical protein LIO53_05825, partial [Oscillospiraceae bacterium]|nr:hypothetical protein [Oscillospiraceae bacterium]
WIKARTSETTQSIIEAAAEMAVLAAQQLYADYSGEIKKYQAMSYMEMLLKEYNLTIDEDVRSNAIESALKAVKIEAGISWFKTELETDDATVE